jgi:hypothetical protein
VKRHLKRWTETYSEQTNRGGPSLVRVVDAAIAHVLKDPVERNPGSNPENWEYLGYEPLVTRWADGQPAGPTKCIQIAVVWNPEHFSVVSAYPTEKSVVGNLDGTCP